MEIVVVGRHAEIADRFRHHVEEKLNKITQFSPYAQRVDVEVTHERNPRLAQQSERIELTVRAKGPAVRAEACSSDRYAALDLAAAKLFERLRRARDRRKTHHTRSPRPDPIVPDELLEQPEPEQNEPDTLVAPTETGVAVESQLGDSPVVVRQKVHDTTPMSVDQALAEMELVGHPFFLFIDEETHQPCVVYYRHGWTYGVIRLAVEMATPAPSAAS